MKAVASAPFRFLLQRVLSDLIRSLEWLSKADQAEAACYATALWRVLASVASLRASMRFICSVPHSQSGASAT